MVLFAFIIMLLNVKRETSPFRRPVSVAIGVIIAGLFLGQLIGIIYSLPGAKETHRCPMATAEQAWNDLKIGQDSANSGKTETNNLSGECAQKPCVASGGCTRGSDYAITKDLLTNCPFHLRHSTVHYPPSPLPPMFRTPLSGRHHHPRGNRQRGIPGYRPAGPHPV